MPELQLAALSQLGLLRWLGCVLSILFLPTQLFAQLPTIEISSLSHVAIERGATTVIRVTGSRVDELDRLVFSHPDFTCEGIINGTFTASQRAPSPTYFSVGTTDAPLGLYDVRAVGRFGISNPRRLLVVDAPVERAVSDHASTATALELTGQRIVQGQFEERQAFHARVALKQGQRLRCCIYTKPIDSRGVPTLVALSPEERELGRSRGIGDWPAEIELVADADGDYLIVAHDFLYRGGGEYPFLLEAAVTADPDRAELSLDRLLRPQPIEASEAATQPLSPPFEVRGSFLDRPSTAIDFSANTNQELWLDVASQQLGQLTDPRLVIYEILDRASETERLRFLTERDDEPKLGGTDFSLGSRDPSMFWKAPRDGIYRVEVRDNEGGQRPEDALGFALSVGPAEPDFALVAYRPFPSNNPAGARQFGSSLMRGGTDSIEVIAIRKHGFSQRIDVSVEGLPPGVQCATAIIPVGGNRTSVTLVATDDAAEGIGHQNLRLIGRSERDDRVLERLADSAAISWPAIPTFNTVISRPIDDLALFVNRLDTAPLLVDMSSGKTTLKVAQGSKLSIPIQVTRRAGGNSVCLLRPKHLPPKTKMGDLTIPADKSAAVAELSVAADAPLGEYTFAMQNETKVKWRANPQALERAEQRLQRLEQAPKDQASGPAANALTTAIQAATDEVERLKKETVEQELTVWLPTTQVRIRIVAKSD